MYQLGMDDMGSQASGSRSTPYPGPVDEQEERGPIFASIGTVLMDCFDVPPLPSIDNQTPALTLPPSPSRTSHSTGSTSSTPQSSSSSPSTHSSLSSLTSLSSLASLTPKSSGSITPQRSFSSDDNVPSSLTAARCKSTIQGNTRAESLNQPIAVLGGGALYALVGARIWLPPRECRTLVDTDEERKDLGKELEGELEAYGEGCWAYQEGRGRRMIKARIRYEGTVRLYKHIVPPLPRSFPSLLDTPIDNSQYLHISPPYSPEDVCKLLSEQREKEQGGGKKAWRPKIVYEPAPLGCHLGQKGFLEEILGGLSVLSPNHEELLSLYGHPIHSLSSPHLRPALEEIITHILDLGIGSNREGIVAVRCGRLGSIVGTRKRGVRWFPAFWEEEEEGRVKDVTGGGNAYLGGFIAGLNASNGDAYEAALYGTISASFIVEQIGLPRLDTLPTSPSSTSSDHPQRLTQEEGQVPMPKPMAGSSESSGCSAQEVVEGKRREDVKRERWNGEIPERRLEVFRKRLGDWEVEPALHDGDLDGRQ